MSTYSIVTFLLTASPHEIQFVGVLLNMCSVSLGMCMIFHHLPKILKAVEDIKCDCNLLSDESVDDSTSNSVADSDTDSVYVQENRIVEEKDGKLVVTTIYAPVLETEEEVREMVEKSPLEESPTEETTEFAELLKKDN